MRIRFVEHASIAIESHNQTILCDPWLVGKVFNNGWALVSPASPPPWAEVDYVWISHEHPDHFNLPSLKSIPDTDKARIKVLYQRHASPRIVDALSKMGFSHVIELPQYKWFQLGDNLEVFCGSSGTMDSFLVVRDRVSKECILNLNDCIFNVDQLRYIKRRVGNVSLLFTQFSFANWVGNDCDETHAAERKIAQLTQQIEIFKPEFTVPFASFVYFCNEENCRMNAWMNTPDSIARLNLKSVNFMYPGDEWDSDSRAFDCEGAREKYKTDYLNIKIDRTPDVVDISQISQAVDKRLQEVKSRTPKLLLRRLPSFAIYIHDLDKVVEVDPAQGVHRVLEGDAQQGQAARYIMCSQVAWFTFAFPWGPNTTMISGMFRDRQFGEKGGKVGWYPLFRLQNWLSTEIFRFVGIKGSLRTSNFFWRKKGEIFFRFTGALRGHSVADD
jgi:UDP-MurNAc hydroxylase